MAKISSKKEEMEQDKRAVVILGRFQPPTIGHYKIVNLAKKFIRENPVLKLFIKPIIVIINGEKFSKDTTENPLTIEQREYFMKNSGKTNGCIFLSAENAFEGFKAVRGNGFEPIVVGSGSDRAQGYLEMLDKYFLDKNYHKQKHYILPGLKTRNDENPEQILKSKNVQIEEISGSLARKAVELGYFDEFVEITGLNKNIPAAKKLYRIIEKGLKE
jgi:hypothetical protein